MWVKICGLTTPEAVEAALAAGADALGFVFAPSPRRLGAAQARVLAAPARGRIPCVAVMRHPAQAELDEVLAAFAPDVLQTDAADFATLQLPATLARLPVLRDGQALPEPLLPRFLFEGALSGAGRTSDWTCAATLARRAALVLAGGLSAHNVASAIAAVQPDGVDVSSGVEEAPGVKSPAAIAAFVAAARAAAPASNPTRFRA